MGLCLVLDLNLVLQLSSISFAGFSSLVTNVVLSNPNSLLSASCAMRVAVKV